jgi:hypothetical protein
LCLALVLALAGCTKTKAADDWSQKALTPRDQTLRGTAFRVSLPEGLENDTLREGLGLTIGFSQKGALADGIRISFHREGLIAPTSLDEAEKRASAIENRVISKKEKRGNAGFLIVGASTTGSQIGVDTWTETPDGGALRCTASDTASGPISNAPAMTTWLERICTSVEVLKVPPANTP